MKLFVLADSHLSDTYDPEFLNWLKENSKDADKIVICGDFWDPGKCSFEEFANSSWKKELFPYLKEKKTLFIYGNHDGRSSLGKGASLFSETACSRYYTKVGNRSFCFEHGHLKIPNLENTAPKLFNFLKIRSIAGFLNDLVVSVFTAQYMRVYKVSVANIANKHDCGGFYVFGHVHYQMLDLDKNYLCLGSSGYGLLNGAIIDETSVTLLGKGYAKKVLFKD